MKHLVNCSFIKGVFPIILKQTIIKPILKKGDTHEFSNYRGIALLSVFPKIFEKAYFDQLASFLENIFFI